MRDRETALVDALLDGEIRLMTENSVASGVQVARAAGDLWAASDVVALMEMPILARFLESRGEQLQRVAADVLQRAGQGEAVAQRSKAAGVSRLSSRQNAEDLARRVAAESMVERIEEAVLAGAGLAPDEAGHS